MWSGSDASATRASKTTTGRAASSTVSPARAHVVRHEALIDDFDAEATGKAAHAEEVVAGLNRVSKFLRGRLSQHIDAKFTPDLKFRHDESFDNAAAIDRLFDDPRVRADLARFPGPDGTDDGA